MQAFAASVDHDVSAPTDDRPFFFYTLFPHQLFGLLSDIGSVALDNLGDTLPDEWRIHFHVPLFASEYEAFGSTQDYVRTVIDLARKHRFTRHLEIETYTWDVLPAGQRPTSPADLADGIAGELAWTRDQLTGAHV